MSFSDTYSQEVLHSRQVRSQRARFWAKIVSIALMITTAAVLHSEPQLRQAIMTAGMDGIMNLTGRTKPTPPASATPDFASLQALMQQALAQPVQPQTSQPAHPRDAVRVNRPGYRQIQGVQFQRVPSAKHTMQSNPAHDAQAQETQSMADQLGRLLKDFRVGQ